MVRACASYADMYQMAGVRPGTTYCPLPASVSGFEVAVIRAITMVELSDVEFEIINLPTLADRLTALIEGRVDW